MDLSFRQMRAVLGITQVQAAEKLGVHVNTVTKAEKAGDKVTKRTFLAMKAVFDKEMNSANES